MTIKTKLVLFGAVVAVGVAAIILNYVSNEFYSFKYGNPIKRVYFKNTLVKAEVVARQDKIEQGLGGRQSVPEGRGMLFAMGKNDFQRFWMKGMQIPIDIIWIADGRVIGCEKNVSPRDTRIFTSPEKAGYVLEVASGFCDQYLVGVNDEVNFHI